MKKLIVDDNICIGCGYCFSSNDIFEQNDEGFACVKESNIDNIKNDELEEIMDIKEGCPVGAIKIEGE